MTARANEWRPLRSQVHRRAIARRSGARKRRQPPTVLADDPARNLLPVRADSAVLREVAGRARSSALRRAQGRAHVCLPLGLARNQRGHVALNAAVEPGVALGLGGVSLGLGGQAVDQWRDHCDPARIRLMRLREPNLCSSAPQRKQQWVNTCLRWSANHASPSAP